MALLDGMIPDDPLTQQGMLAIAAGLMAGRPAQGVMGFAQAVSPENRAKLNLTNAQIDDIKQQVGLRNIQLQQQQEQWNLLAPIMRAYANGGAPGSTSAPPAQNGALLGNSTPAIPPTPGGPLGSGTFGIPTGGQDATAAPPAAPSGGGDSMFGVPRNVGIPALMFGGPKALADTITSYNSPTDFIKSLRAAGVQEGSPQWNDQLTAYLKKQTNIPLQAGRAGAPMYNSDGQIIAMAPKIPDNAIPQVVGGRVVGVSPLPGGQQVQQMNSYAEAAGKAQTKPITAYRGNQPVFTNELAAAQGGDPLANLPPSQPDVSGKFYGDPRDAIAGIAAITDPQQRSNAYAAFVQNLTKGNGALPAGPGAQLTPQPALGAAEGAGLSQQELSKKWGALTADNAQAQTTASYLDSIKQLAQKAAVGPFTDKLQFANALLAQVGSERALDATTANNLLDKYGSQIVSRLGGSGGLSTDAARAILQSAYPNAHMTADAINEAADNLKGANLMIQAKARLLQQPANSRDPATYSQKELVFDQNADPRIWQLQNMDAKSAQAFLSRMPPNVRADLQRRAQALKQAGAL